MKSTGSSNEAFWMTAAAYLGWYARLYGVSPTGREIVMLLEKVGPGTVARLSIGAFSRGMNQRLAIARALLSLFTSVSWAARLPVALDLRPG